MQTYRCQRWQNVLLGWVWKPASFCQQTWAQIPHALHTWSPVPGHPRSTRSDQWRHHYLCPSHAHLSRKVNRWQTNCKWLPKKYRSLQCALLNRMWLQWSGPAFSLSLSLSLFIHIYIYIKEHFPRFVQLLSLLKAFMFNMVSSDTANRWCFIWITSTVTH